MEKSYPVFKKGLVLGIFILLALSSIMPITGSLLIKKEISSNNEISNIQGKTRGTILYVGGIGPNNYTTIQSAIDIASDGDTVFIYNDSSPYYENVKIKNKKINLIGEDTNSTIIDEGGNLTTKDWALLLVEASGSTVCNLTLQNATSKTGTNWALLLDYSDNVKIINCYIKDSFRGMMLFYSRNTFMRNNRIENNTNNFGMDGWSYAADFYDDIDTTNTINGKPIYDLVNESNVVLDGIDIGWLGLMGCSNITVKNITISDCENNIMLINTKYSTISNCIINNTDSTSIKIGFDSDNNLIENCPVIDGIGFITNEEDKIPENNIVSNCNLTFGMSFQKSNYNLIENCDINLEVHKPGTYGFIAFYQGNYNTISNCTIYNNTYWGVGMHIAASDDWEPYGHHNNIINNTFYGFSVRALGLLFNADYNNIIGNRFINSNYGVYIKSNDPINDLNTIYHNNFIDNTINAYDAGDNYWNNIYPSGGNYWDDYSVDDNFRGPKQDIPGSDGLGDNPYNLSGADNQDLYPLIFPFGENPPFANFSIMIDEYEAFFDASSSIDRDGSIVSYEWDFGDNIFGDGMIINHTYSENGTYNVVLTLTDDDNKQVNLSQFINIPNNPPNTPSDPEPVDGATEIDINAVLSWNCSDPEEDTLTYDVYFEEDDPTPDILVSENQTETTYDPDSMKYSTTYYWKIVAWDNHGASTEGPIWKFTTMAGSNHPPNKTKIFEEDETLYVYTTDIDDDNIMYIIDWDDGTTTETDYYPSGQNVEINHEWPGPGIYYIRAKGKDVHNAEGEWSDPYEIIIGNIPPETPDITGPNKGNPGIEYTYTIVTDDFNEDDVFYYIDWDDVNIDEWIGPYASGEEVTVNHIWDGQGTYIIKIKAKDTFDAESDWSYFDIEIPRNRTTFNSLFHWFLERFPLLEKLLNLFRY